MLNVPFILGRPLGKPDDPDFQHRVLSAALNLLPRTDGPVSENWEEDAIIEIAEAEGWSCPVSFATESEASLRERVLSEVSLLAPWYEKGLATRGHTSFGLSESSIETVVSYIAGYAEGDIPTAPDAGEMLKHAAEDLKAFYNESATSQLGKTTARELEDWYWKESSAGELVKAARKTGAASDNGSVKLSANFLLVPESQLDH